MMRKRKALELEQLNLSEYLSSSMKASLGNDALHGAQPIHILAMLLSVQVFEEEVGQLWSDPSDHKIVFECLL